MLTWIPSAPTDTRSPHGDQVHASAKAPPGSPCHVLGELGGPSRNESPFALPRKNCPRAGTKSPLDSPMQVTAAEAPSAILGVLTTRPHGRAGSTKRESLPLTGIRDPQRLSLTRGTGHRPTQTGAGEPPRAARGSRCAHTSRCPSSSRNIGELADVGVGLRPRQRLGQHPASHPLRTISSINRRRHRQAEPSRVSRESELTVSIGVVTSRPALSRRFLLGNLSSVTREGYAPSQGRSTDFKHCSRIEDADGQRPH